MKWVRLKRAKVAVRGEPVRIPMKGMTAPEEHTHFLHSLLTNDVRGLKPYHFNYHLQLRPNGQPLADYFLYRFEDHYLLDTDRPPQEVIGEFSRLKLSLKVYFEDLTPRLEHLFLFGEGAEGFLEERFGLRIEPLQFRVVEGLLVARNPLRFGIDGYDLVGEPETIDLPSSAQVREELLESIRIENCVPRIGKELREGFSPLEAGMAGRAIALNKGCYVGQEAIARVYFRGRTPRVLVRFRLLGEVMEGEEVFENGRKVGVITSVSREGGLALGYLLRSSFREGALFRAGEGEVKVEGRCPDGEPSES